MLSQSLKPGFDMPSRYRLKEGFEATLNIQSRRWLDNDLVDQSTNRGFLHFWGIEGVEGYSLGGGNIGKFRGGIESGDCFNLLLGR